MTIQSELCETLNAIADVAESVKRKLGWFLAIGLVASAGMAFQAYSPTSALWWNVFKCGFILLPSLIIAFIWNALGQLKEAPELAASLASNEDGLIGTLQSSGLSRSSGVTGLFGTLRAFRKEQGLGVVLDTIGNVTLLANPLVALISIVMIVILVLMIIVAPLLLLL